jgi:hypothetical protein
MSGVFRNIDPSPPGECVPPAFGAGGGQTRWVYTVQTLDLILLCARCIPQMHFYRRSKIYLLLLPCLGNNFTKQGNIASSLKNIYILSQLKHVRSWHNFPSIMGQCVPLVLLYPLSEIFYTLSLTPDAISLATRKRFTLSPFKQVQLV